MPGHTVGGLSNTAIRPSFRHSVRLSIPWRSCLGYRHAGCLQLSHRRPPEMCGLRTRPRTDVDPPRFLPPSNFHLRGHIVSPPPGRHLLCCLSTRASILWCVRSVLGMHLFGGKFCRHVDDNHICTCAEILSDQCVCHRKNFDTLHWSLVTVFQV